MVKNKAKYGNRVVAKRLKKVNYNRSEPDLRREEANLDALTIEELKIEVIIISNKRTLLVTIIVIPTTFYYTGIPLCCLTTRLKWLAPMHHP